MDEQTPQDVVPPRGLTREAILAMNKMSGAEVTMTTPGEFLEDVDGLPLSVGPSIVRTATFGGATITLSELTAAGLTQDDVPNINVVDLEKEH